MSNLLSEKVLPVIAFVATFLLFFYPILFGNVAFNGPALVSLYTPFMFEEYEGYPAGVPSMQGMSDQIKLYVPYLRFTRDQWRAGQIPLWNPHNFSGTPHLAEWQSAVFYPLILLGSAISLVNMWHVLVITGFVFCSVFTYWYLRTLTLSRFSSFIGALSFGAGSVVVRWSQEIVMAPHAVAMLPLLLIGIDKWIKTRQFRWWLLGLLAATNALLSGYLQVALYVFTASVVYLGYRLWSCEGKWLRGLQWLVVYVCAIGLTAWQVLPGFELFLESSRRVVDIRSLLSQYLLSWQFLVNILIPDFFGHPLTQNEYGFEIGSFYERPLWVGTLSVIGIVIWWVHRRNIGSDPVFWIVVGLLSLSIVFALPTSRLFYMTRTPFFSDAIPHRILFLPSFAWVVVGGMGLDWWLKHTSVRTILKTSLVFFVFFLLVFLVVQSVRLLGLSVADWPASAVWTQVALRNSVLPLLFFATFVSLLLIWAIAGWVATLRLLVPTLVFGTRVRKVALFLIATFVIFELWLSFRKFTVFSPPQFFYPNPLFVWLQQNAGIERFWGYGDAFVPNNLATYYGLYTPEGYDSLNSHRYAQLLLSMETGRLDRPVSRSDAGMLRAPDGLYALHEHPRRLRLMGMLNVRYFLDKEGEIKTSPFNEKNRFQSTDFELAWTDGKWRIFRFPGAYPRAYMVSHFVVEKDDQAILDRLYDPSFSPRDTVVLEEEPPGHLQPDIQATGRVEILRYTPDEVIVSTSSSGRQLLLLADNFFPGWVSKVDGAETPMYRANFTFRAVSVPAGEHQVVFRYEPQPFRNGLYISGATLLFVGILGVSHLRRRPMR